MALNSMSLFGFLSKANIEQVAVSEEQQAQIQHIVQQINDQNAIIAQAKQRITTLGSDNATGDVVINARIADANKIIDNAMQRVQPQIDEQQHIIDLENNKIDQQAKLIQNQIDDIDKQIAALDNDVKVLSDQNKISLAQRKQNQQRIERERLAKQKAQLLTQITEIRNAPNNTIISAKNEITKIRAKVDNDVKQAHDTISKMTAQLGQTVNIDKVQADVDEQNQRIKTASDQIDQLTSAKFKLESESRKLEVEVGPIKYIAQIFYGDDVDQKLLAHAVRWVIMLLIFVFDPLAILMLIASNQGMIEYRRKKEGLIQATPNIKNKIVKTSVSKIEPLVGPKIESPTISINTNSLTTLSEPVIINNNELAKDVNILNSDSGVDRIDVFDSRNNNFIENNEIHSYGSNVMIINQSLGPVGSTEDLLSVLAKAHSSRLYKSGSKLSNNEQKE
jgi:hypothetical protein